MRCSVSILRDPRYFVEIAEALRDSLRALGHEVATGRLVRGGRNIVLAPQALDRATLDRLPAGTILYNFEQLAAQPPVADFAALCGGVRHVEWWDYSSGNLALLRRLGFRGRARWVPLGFAPSMCRVADRAEPDIDVLFYGGLSPRREAVLERLRGRCRCYVAVNCFGAARDRLIGRAKVVLNVHYYESFVLETPRVVYLLANGKAVVSERNPTTEIEPWIERAIVTAPYEDLADACLALVADEPRRLALAGAAAGRAREADMTRILAAALGEDREAAAG
ncbi:MAG: hypothetical protein IT561_14665 [Alphaproteobacteria bacterium]|nr:hypothetical protein [Alphaproteobacteria bacterium]